GGATERRLAREESRGAARVTWRAALRLVGALGLLGLAACAEDPAVLCDGDASCELSCPDGFCNFYCDGDSSCAGSCAGGECTLTCTGDARCDFACPTGDCALFCQDR